MASGRGGRCASTPWPEPGDAHQPLERGSRRRRAGSATSSRVEFVPKSIGRDGSRRSAHRPGSAARSARRPSGRPGRRRRRGTRRSGRAGTSRPAGCRRRRRTAAGPRGRRAMARVALGGVAGVGGGERVGVDARPRPARTPPVGLEAADGRAQLAGRPASSGSASACRRRAAARCGSRPGRRRRRARRPRSRPGAGGPSRRGDLGPVLGRRRRRRSTRTDGLNSSDGAGAAGRAPRGSRPAPRAAGRPLEHRRSGRVEQVEGSASGKSIRRTIGSARLGRPALVVDRVRLGRLGHVEQRRRASSAAAPARRSAIVGRWPATARSTTAPSRQLVGEHGGLEVVDELAEQLGAHVGQHAPTELGHLAGDGEVGDRR